MNGFHPKANRAAMCAVTAAILACGCKSTSTGVNNAFMSPDRVTPPSTRMIAPGQAQPYYQGDPLPVMQSATAPPNSNLAETATPTSALSSSGKTLGWNAPNGGAPLAAAPPTTAPTFATTTPPPFGVKETPGPVVNEAPVAVPTDTDSLRFALPAPVMPEPAMPIAAANAVTTPQAATASNQGVQQASFNVPAPAATKALAPPASVAGPNAASPVNTPWRSPQVPATSCVPAGVQTQPSQVPASQQMPQPYYTPTAAPVSSNPVAVNLRAVPSPPQPGDPMPRVRIPGYEVPQTANADGFRPRSTMR
jgi:hypothetical protein